MRFYARQIAPEYQQSYLDLDREYLPGLILDGNRHFSGLIPEEFQRIWDYYDDAAAHLEDIIDRMPSPYRNASELIQDFFPAGDYRSSGRYSTRAIHAIREALKLYGTRAYYSGAHILDMLDALTGHDWRYMELRGCCQGDWQGVYYDSSLWSLEALRAFEIEYFNLGEEWIIHDTNAEPDGPDDVCGYSVYISGDDTRAELADVIGCSPEELTLYAWSGWSRSATYKEA